MCVKLIAVPYEEATGEFNLVRIDSGEVYLRVQTGPKWHIDHDLMVKEIMEAPSTMRLSVKESLTELLGTDDWKVFCRIPGNSVMRFESILSMNTYPSALQLKLDSETNKVVRTKL